MTARTPSSEVPLAAQSRRDLFVVLNGRGQPLRQHAQRLASTTHSPGLGSAAPFMDIDTDAVDGLMRSNNCRMARMDRLPPRPYRHHPA